MSQKKVIGHTKSAVVEDISSQRMQSASLNHMVPSNDISQKNKEQTKEVTDSLMDLNIKYIKEEIWQFHGFHAPVPNDLGKNLNKEEINGISCSDEEVIKEGNNQCKLVLNQTLTHEEASTTETEIIGTNLTKNETKPIAELKRSEYLEIARSKYFFQDEGTPSFRLMEFVDDNGKTIEEPEFYRPLEMDDYTYNEKCEAASIKCKESELNCVNNQHSNVNSTPNRSPIRNVSNTILNIESTENECETTIQCGQKEPSHTGLTFSQTRSICKAYVDLVSPEVTIPTQNHMKLNKSSSTDQTTPSYGKALIVGRRLFEGNDEDYNESNSKSKSPIRELLNNFVNVS